MPFQDDKPADSGSPWAFILLLVLTTILVALAIPNFVKARRVSSMDRCFFNRMWIEEAKQKWASDLRKTSSDEPTVSDIVPYLAKVKPKWDGRFSNAKAPTTFPTCHLGGTILPGKVGERTSCSEAAKDAQIHSWDEREYRYHYGRKER